jgi:hypothetical protein
MPAYNKKVLVPGKSKAEIYQAIDPHLDRMLEKFSIGNAKLSKNSSLFRFEIESSLFSATLICEEGQVNVEGKLSMMAVAFKKNIDDGIEKFIKKYLS